MLAKGGGTEGVGGRIQRGVDGIEREKNRSVQEGGGEGLGRDGLGVKI